MTKTVQFLVCLYVSNPQPSHRSSEPSLLRQALMRWRDFDELKLGDTSQRQIQCNTKHKQLLLFDCFVSRICVLSRYGRRNSLSDGPCIAT